MSDNDTAIVKSCPVCLRCMWVGAQCDHGKIPPPKGMIDGVVTEQRMVGTASLKELDGKSGEDFLKEQR